MNVLVFLVVVFKSSLTCTPSLSSPLISTPAAQPITLISNPQLPPIAFQMDNSQPKVPQAADYVDEPVTIQKDSILPLQGERLKNRFSLFDLFRPLAQPATSQPILINEKPVDVVSMNITFSPPVHWTFCYPSCGVGDQAVDSDDAYEKAHDDVLEAVNRCKSVMNVIRRAFSFRDKRPTKQPTEEASGSSIEMKEVAKPRVDSLPSSDMPSTSASSPPVRVPTVYEDPFVAINANGTIFIKHYYNFQERAEYRMESARLGHVKRNSRIIKAKDISKIYYATANTCTDPTLCKNWGICMNNVWWASHLSRMDPGNVFTNVVLIDDSLMYPGLSVVNIDAFAESLQCVGLPRDAPFQNGLPNPPLSMLSIPYIDEDDDEIPKKRKTRRNPSKAKKPE
ncbi:unnamed protein product [Caenorhabditis sp. 36 PRJEB53466]|nr:unnamed protein product [Caenorhabditis sp. 36 PRJEB53466]